METAALAMVRILALATAAPTAGTEAVPLDQPDMVERSPLTAALPLLNVTFKASPGLCNSTEGG